MIGPTRNSLIVALLAGVTVFLYVVTVNSYLENSQGRISGDGLGYYDYLPSIFIYHDLDRKDADRTGNPVKYDRVINDTEGVYVEDGSKLVNKYTVGPALLQLPFFLTSLLTNGNERSQQYKVTFNNSVFHGALFYLFLGLFFQGMLLRSFGHNYWGTGFILGLTLLATPLVYYSNANAAYSHVYSFFAIAGFSYVVRAFTIRPRRDLIAVAGFLLGLVILIRPVNILVLLAIPLLAGSAERITEGWNYLRSNKLHVGLAGLLMVGIMSLQSWVWYQQTGQLLVDTYPGEGFNFLEPELMNILFSYRKGLFIYTPLLFVSLLSVGSWLKNRNRLTAFSYVGFLSVLVYIFSSWWCWPYGSTFGQRVFLDFLPILLLPLPFALRSLKGVYKAFFIVVLLALIPLNIIQSYQIQNYILHAGDTTKESYWQLFLKTHERYEGISYQRKLDADNYDQVELYEVGDFVVPPNTDKLLFHQSDVDLPNSQGEAVINVSVDHQFNENCDARMLLVLRSSVETTLWHHPYLIQFSKEGFNRFHTGHYNYSFVHTAPTTYDMELRLLTDSLEVSVFDISVEAFVKKH